MHTDFPFGFTVGDREVPPALDGSSDAIFLSPPFPYFGTLESIIYVSSACLMYIALDNLVFMTAHSVFQKKPTTMLNHAYSSV